MILAPIFGLPAARWDTLRIPGIAAGIFLALAAICVAPLHADDAYTRNPARGLAIYKPNTFQKDNAAQITEYRTHQSLASVTYIVTMDGARLTIPAKTADVVILPYPGRGEAQPEEALATLSLAEYRFPQFQSLLIPLKAAWMQEAKRPRKQIDDEIQSRRENQSIAGRVGAFWNSLMKPNFKPTPSPSPKPSPVIAKVTESPLQPSPDLHKNLKTINEFYRSMDSVTGNGTDPQ